MNYPYTSTELFHFVGRSHPDDDEANYATLLKVLDDGWVSYAPDFPKKYEFKMSSPNWDEEYVLLGGNIYPEVTCYAAIPFDALAIHINKYGRFGLSFDRAMLIKNGARPVIYFPLQPSDPMSGWGNIHTELNGIDLLAVWKGFYEMAVAPNAQNVFSRSLGAKPQSSTDAILAMNSVLSAEFFRFIKFFNSDLDEKHPENYYMEQEWRIPNPFAFKLSEIESICVSCNYVARFKEDRPEYLDKVRTVPN